MAGLAKAEEIRFPAALTTKDGLTHNVADADELQERGLANKSWEEFRGGYREQGCRPYKDGRVSVGAAKLAGEAAKSDKKTVEKTAAPPPPPEAPKQPKRRSRRSPSDTSDD